MTESKTKNRYWVLDLFSGAGGLTEEFLRKNFDFVSHIEINHHASNTLETRILYYKLIKEKQKDLYYQYYNGEISREEFFLECKNIGLINNGIINQEISDNTRDSIINNIKNHMKELENNLNVDVLIGGPPCQAYSLLGRSRDPNRMRTDPRNSLYLHYLKFIQEFQPTFFIFENVPGMISAKNGEIYRDFISKINELGYTSDIKPRILDAQNFGVIQTRKRIIVIGWKRDYDFSYPEFFENKPDVTVNDILRDLPPLNPGEGTDDLQHYRRIRPSKYLSKYGIRTDEKGIRQHSARIHNERDREIYRIAINLWNTKRKRLHYDELPSELKTHRNRTTFHDRFKVVDGNGKSHAIVAHLSKDGHFFIHPDIKQARSLTVREAARIQSFPDNYLFEGPRTSQYVQVGNAVPPLMAEGIAVEIEKMLAEI
ncbi:MAG TPA: DNA cytosine methyltransferase [Bacteroidales bacterium]|nr:DNA cytosine methyltransferase [Bacteroidales bacterium]